MFQKSSKACFHSTERLDVAFPKFSLCLFKDFPSLVLLALHNAMQSHQGLTQRPQSLDRFSLFCSLKNTQILYWFVIKLQFVLMTVSCMSRTISLEAIRPWSVLISLLKYVSVILSALLGIYLTLFLKSLRALTHWLDFTLKAKLSWTNKQLMPEQWWQNCVQEKSSTLFLGRFCGWKAWEEAGSQCGCRGDGRRRKELEQTEGKWVWWALPPIN